MKEANAIILKLQSDLASDLETLLNKYGDKPEIRERIANYVIGYLGVRFVIKDITCIA